MNVLDTYPLITVCELQASRDFFINHFDMVVVFEATWVAMLSSKDDNSISLGLMSANHPSRPPGPGFFGGQGMIITVQVESAIAAYARLKANGVPLELDLRSEPWGQKRFMVRDPSGIYIDVVEQIDPAAGYWDQFLVD